MYILGISKSIKKFEKFSIFNKNLKVIIRKENEKLKKLLE